MSEDLESFKQAVLTKPSMAAFVTTSLTEVGTPISLSCK